MISLQHPIPAALPDVTVPSTTLFQSTGTACTPKPLPVSTEPLHTVTAGHVLQRRATLNYTDTKSLPNVPFNPRPSDTTSSTGGGGGSSNSSVNGALIGGIAGGVILLLLIVGLLFWCCRRGGMGMGMGMGMSHGFGGYNPMMAPPTMMPPMMAPPIMVGPSMMGGAPMMGTPPGVMDPMGGMHAVGNLAHSDFVHHTLSTVNPGPGGVHFHLHMYDGQPPPPFYAGDLGRLQSGPDAFLPSRDSRIYELDPDAGPESQKSTYLQYLPDPDVLKSVVPSSRVKSGEMEKRTEPDVAREIMGRKRNSIDRWLKTDALPPTKRVTELTAKGAATSEVPSGDGLKSILRSSKSTLFADRVKREWMQNPPSRKADSVAQPSQAPLSSTASLVPSSAVSHVPPSSSVSQIPSSALSAHSRPVSSAIEGDASSAQSEGRIMSLPRSVDLQETGQSVTGVIGSQRPPSQGGWSTWRESTYPPNG